VVELHATKILHVGPCDASKYPIAKKKISLEMLREKIHLRTRTNTIQAIARIRSALAFATHSFFNQNGFQYVHTPLITQSDCEGAGEMFQVTTLLGAVDAEVGSRRRENLHATSPQPHSVPCSSRHSPHFGHTLLEIRATGMLLSPRHFHHTLNLRLLR
jgi:aspartyl/asparaginyl-tRNA synthetase